MENRDVHIKIESGLMEFNGNTIVIYSDNFKLDADGNSTFSGDLEAAKGTFSGDLQAAGGTFKGNLSAAGGSFKGDLSAAGGTFSGNLNAAGGTFAGDLSAAGGTFAGNLSAAGGTFKGNLNAAGGTFKGELSAATGTFAGSLSAASGTFKGSLNAATGEFKGKVAFSFKGPNTYSQDIYINDTTKNSGIYLKRTGSSYGTLETFIDAGYIELAQSSPDRSYAINSQSSDRRQKEKIDEIDLDIPLKLRPLQFHFKGDDAICYGFIAQDVEEVIPNAVTTNERTGYLMLDYHELIAPTLALAQHNNSLIESLTKQIETLEARIKALEDKT
jgi:cytoskeletal protein CcmA (bactofilin family)